MEWTAQRLIDMQKAATKTAQRPGRCRHMNGEGIGPSYRSGLRDQEPWSSIIATRINEIAVGDTIMVDDEFHYMYSVQGWERERIVRACRDATPDDPQWVPAGEEALTAERAAELRSELEQMYIETFRL